MTRQRIGALLVAAETITPEQLQEALEGLRRRGQRERLGEAVVRLGLAPASHAADAVAQQRRLQRIQVEGCARMR